MNETEQSHLESVAEIRKVARSIRFALVAIVLGLSYFGIRGSLGIESSRQVFTDLFEKHPLPALTVFVIAARPLFLTVSFLVPLAAVATLFMRNLACSFYFLGALAFVAIVEWIVLFHALFGPLAQILTSLGADAAP